MVVGRISALRNGTTRNGNPYLFMNFGVYPHQTFTIVLWSEALAAFRLKGINPDSFRGKYICITGVLGTYSGTPQMSVDFTSQMQELSGENEARQYLSSFTAPPIQNTTRIPVKTTSKSDEFDDLINEIYRNKPVTPKPQVKTPTYSSTQTSTYKPSTSTPTYKPSTSKSKTSKSGLQFQLFLL